MSSVVVNTSAVVMALRPFTTYSLAVSARNSIGYGPFETVSEFTPEDGNFNTIQ
jgi:hypothetical protein